MRPPVAIVGAGTAAWIGSPALNSMNVPWGASGALPSYATAIAIWLLSVLLMSVAFRQIEPEPLKKLPAILFILVGFLILAEVVFWTSLPESENKGMLLRMWIGNRAGFI